MPNAFRREKSSRTATQLNIMSTSDRRADEIISSAHATSLHRGTASFNTINAEPTAYDNLNGIRLHRRRYAHDGAHHRHHLAHVQQRQDFSYSSSTSETTETIVIKILVDKYGSPVTTLPPMTNPTSSSSSTKSKSKTRSSSSSSSTPPVAPPPPPSSSSSSSSSVAAFAQSTNAQYYPDSSQYALSSPSTPTYENPLASTALSSSSSSSTSSSSNSNFQGGYDFSSFSISTNTTTFSSSTSSQYFALPPYTSSFSYSSPPYSSSSVSSSSSSDVPIAVFPVAVSTSSTSTIPPTLVSATPAPSSQSPVSSQVAYVTSTAANAVFSSANSANSATASVTLAPSSSPSPVSYSSEAGSLSQSHSLDDYGGSTSSVVLPVSTSTSASATATTTAASSGGGGSSLSGEQIGGIIGGLAGGILFLTIIGLVIYRWRKRTQQQSGIPQISGPISDDSEKSAVFGAGSSFVSLTTTGIMPTFLKRGRFSAATASTTSTEPSERGFQKISGRKLPSIIAAGDEGYGDKIPPSLDPLSPNSPHTPHIPMSPRPHTPPNQIISQTPHLHPKDVPPLMPAFGHSPRRRNSVPSPVSPTVYGPVSPPADDEIVYMRPGPARTISQEPTPATPPPQSPSPHHEHDADADAASRASRFTESSL